MKHHRHIGSWKYFNAPYNECIDKYEEILNSGGIKGIVSHL